MQIHQGGDNKGPGPHQGAPQPAYAQPGQPQPGFAPYGYPSNNLPPQDLHYVPNVATDTDPMVKGFEFSTESIRRGFIRKVYSILSVS